MAWDTSLPLLSCQWLGAASGNRWHQFRTSDRTAEAVHKARKTVLRRCADDVRVYETAIMEKNAEIARLRERVAELEEKLTIAMTILRVSDNSHSAERVRADAAEAKLAAKDGSS